MLTPFLFVVLGVLFAYRLLASTFLPRLCEKRHYILLCIILLLLVPVLLLIFGDDSVEFGTIFLWILLSPFFILGAIGIMRRFRWYYVLLSCVLEALLLPIWLIVVFVVGLCLEEDDDMASARPKNIRNHTASDTMAVCQNMV